MSRPYAYATNIELIAASQLYGVEFRVTLDGSDYSQPPPDNSTICDFYTIQIPSTTPSSDTINMWTTYSNILYPTSSPPIAISYTLCKIPYPYGIYHTPYFVASTSAPELCQPHQTDTCCAHPTRFVPSGTTSRRGALYVYV